MKTAFKFLSILAIVFICGCDKANKIGDKTNKMELTPATLGFGLKIGDILPSQYEVEKLDGNDLNLCCRYPPDKSSLFEDYFVYVTPQRKIYSISGRRDFKDSSELNNWMRQNKEALIKTLTDKYGLRDTDGYSSGGSAYSQHGVKYNFGPEAYSVCFDICEFSTGQSCVDLEYVDFATQQNMWREKSKQDAIRKENERKKLSDELKKF